MLGTEMSIHMSLRDCQGMSGPQVSRITLQSGAVLRTLILINYSLARMIDEGKNVDLLVF